MRTLTKLVYVAGLVATLIPGADLALAETPNVVVRWNQTAQSLFTPAPGPSIRWLPMLHIAMFDAVNSIEDGYAPYHTRVKGSHGASAIAAAAQAARDVLTAWFPAEEARFDAELASDLASLPPGPARRGQAVGRRVAQAVLDWRTGDGWPTSIVPDPSYVLPPFPGAWRPAPPANGAATFTFFPKVTPFALLTATQYLPSAPPILTSARYARDFNETKRLGSESSAERTPEETLLAQLFAGVNTTIGFHHVWNIVAARVAERERLSLVDTARLFALLNVAFHDGLQTSFTSKYTYGFWRPVTAIRTADEDLNPDTDAEAAWTPLLATPPYPSYAGNAACLSAASARILQLVSGRDDVPFAITWPRTGGLPTEQREFGGFRQLADQQARSRIHGGIHFQFESEASQASCGRVAEFVHARFMKAKRQ